MTRYLSIWSAPLWIMVSAAMITSTDRSVFDSGSWAVHTVYESGLVVIPVLASLVAGDITRLTRPGNVLLHLALPNRDRTRSILRPAAIGVGYATLGLVCSLLIVVVISAVRGHSPEPHVFFPLLPLVLLMTLTSLLGATLAAVARSWVVPPTIGIAIYGCAAFDLLGIYRWFDYVGAGGDTAAITAPLPGVYLSNIGLLILLCIALVLSAHWALVNRRWAAGAIVAMFAISMFGANLLPGDTFRDADTKDWPCEAIHASDSTVCLPREQSPHLSLTAAVVEPFDARLQALLTAPKSLRYQPGNTTKADVLSIPLVIGNEERDPARFAESITGSLDACATADWGLFDGVALEDRLLDRWRVELWLNPNLASVIGIDPPVDVPVSRDDATTALQRLSAPCPIN